MVFQVNQLDYELHFLAYRNTNTLSERIKSEWASYHVPGLLQLVSNVEIATQARYLRHSRLLAIKQRIAVECARWQSWIDSSQVDGAVKDAVHKLRAMHKWTDTDIEEIRERYIQKQLNNYADFFQRVESNPLTEKQRRACIIDDDNNLLLAGAGTGKTSVMVGRAGYLLVSGQACTEDILLLAYGKKAAAEMDQRIKDKLGIETIKTSTFHSLGLSIIAQVEGKTPKLSAWVADEQSKSQWVEARLKCPSRSAQYQKRLLEYLSDYYFQPMSPFDFESQSEYQRYLKDNRIFTLKGERVSCFVHVYIANWFYKNGIEYRYHAQHCWSLNEDRNRRKSGHNSPSKNADFYLPETDVYIDFYHLDEQGNTPPYINQVAYQKTIKCKRERYKQQGTRCVELRYSQYAKGKLNSVLKGAANKMQLKTTPMSAEILFCTLQKSKRMTELADLFCKLINLYKASFSSKFSVKSVMENVVKTGIASDIKQVRLAYTLLLPIYQQYQKHLKEHDEIDFEDMINEATTYVENGRFLAPWRYIMVDEFQDISQSRARLVRALRDSRWPNLTNKPASKFSAIDSSRLKQGQPASVFCVGDDWQAIYRFSGADISLTTGFSQYFGHTSENVLDQTFRFNDRISEVATRFISQNPEQITKDICSRVKADEPRVSILSAATAISNSDGLLHQALTVIARNTKETQRQKQTHKVFILGRFWFQLPDKTTLDRLNHLYDNLEISCLSFHAAKGKEADYAIITGMTKGQHGFPPNKPELPALNALLPKKESYMCAEERRLFYVGLTRARNHVYILADMLNVSPFVTEVMDGTYDIEQIAYSETESDGMTNASSM
jgi:DNA helicase-4